MDHHMSKIILDESQHASMQDDEVATLRVYVSAAAKKAVVIKDDDLLNKAELMKHQPEVAKATQKELQVWMDNKCFKQIDLAKAQNVMTVSYTHLTLPTILLV